LKGVYERFGLPMPVVYPRKSLTIVEKKVDRVLKKFDLTVPDFRGDLESLVRSISERGIPESLTRALSSASSHLDQDFEPLIREIAAFEPTLKDSAHLAQGKMKQQWQFLEKKIVQAATKQNDIAVQQLRKAGDQLYPNGHLQERVFTIAPYLLKYGPSFLDTLDGAIDLDAHDHQLLTM
jgi:bacillithiol synthase